MYHACYIKKRDFLKKNTKKTPKTRPDHGPTRAQKTDISTVFGGLF